MTEQAKRWSKRRRREGMTLVEMMIVVIIMAMIAAAVGVAVLPKWRQAQREAAATDAQTVRSAALTWVMAHGSDCPSVDQLRDDGEIDRARRMADPWDNAFTIECQGDEIIVASAGPNEQMGDEDDVRTDRRE